MSKVSCSGMLSKNRVNAILQSSKRMNVLEK